MFQMGGIGPMFGQVGFFHKFAGKDYEDKRPRDRYVAEVEAPARRARPAPRRAATGSWATTYTIADIAIFPWVRNLIGFYGAGDLDNPEKAIDPILQELRRDLGQVKAESASLAAHEQRAKLALDECEAEIRKLAALCGKSGGRREDERALAFLQRKASEEQRSKS